ncbi:hypothetical protein T11_7878 [Trichinella zimbabwensis]|uniref:Uncharacterized protein n=1 Tax=Trichinella zimbabwensis TaxID=268475 RepID=A0A0V1GIM7_9BILA|nr:hypothetical protein T11_16901 [Trichinella zimbabwensis]KRY98103.1 hypothetical protein T11_7878 [Trichinella zimbabwensis]
MNSSSWKANTESIEQRENKAQANVRNANAISMVNILFRWCEITGGGV